MIYFITKSFGGNSSYINAEQVYGHDCFKNYFDNGLFLKLRSWYMSNLAKAAEKDLNVEKTTEKTKKFQRL